MLSLGMVQPMPLVRRDAPFDDPGWLFEVKADGFRALAFIEGGQCRLVSRHQHVFRGFQPLAAALGREVRVHDAVLDGEIVCVDGEGRTRFHDLLFKRGHPVFFAFDLLAFDGQDMRQLPLVERKRHLRRVIPPDSACVLYVEHVVGSGCALYRAVCERDLEGIVAKWAHGTYQADRRTSWVKVLNPTYSQKQGRRELFEVRLDRRNRRQPPAVLVLG